MYKAVIFDLDGTLLDTLCDLKDSLNVVLNEFSMPERSLMEVRKFVGNGIHKLIERAVVPNTENEEIEKIFVRFKEYYLLHCLDKTRPYDGIMELIYELKKKNVPMAIVSNKGHEAVVSLAREMFPDIKIAIGERNGVKKKPAPDMVDIALEKLGVNREETVYVGDSEVDRETAKNSKLACVSVTWGFRDKDLLVSLNPEYIIDTPKELLDIISSEN